MFVKRPSDRGRCLFRLLAGTQLVGLKGKGLGHDEREDQSGVSVHLRAENKGAFHFTDQQLCAYGELGSTIEQSATLWPNMGAPHKQFK